MPKFQFGGGGYSETEKCQSAKICLNFNLGGYSEIEKSKCQDLPKFQFSGGYSETEKCQSAKICLNFNWGGGILKLKSVKVPRYA